MNDLVLPDSISDLIKIDKKLMDKINKRLPEFNRTKAMIGHSHSQASYSLQTMNMIDSAPLSRMKQCLSQIRKKYEALKCAYYDIEEKKLEIKKTKVIFNIKFEFPKFLHQKLAEFFFVDKLISKGFIIFK